MLTWRSATASRPAPAARPARAGPIGSPPGSPTATPDFVYRNLAVDGATSADVLDQLGEALQLEPDLVTVVCGANDVLFSVRPDLDAYARAPRRDLQALDARPCRRCGS